jgi:pimeloyl-ACP methyl ester carboxylesterase
VPWVTAASWVKVGCDRRLRVVDWGCYPTAVRNLRDFNVVLADRYRIRPCGPRDDLPVVLIHAGIADRRMWDPQWSALTAERDAVRLDLRGFGESTERPRGVLSPPDDVIDTLAALGIGRCHLVGSSFGAGVAVEVALTRPEQVDSL